MEKIVNLRLEYVWIDGSDPAQLRSKVKFIKDASIKSISDVPVWNFDGSSTQQAPGDDSECLLIPARLYPAGNLEYIVFCEVYKDEKTPHKTNNRFKLRETIRKNGNFDTWYGFEQEYFITKDDIPLGFKQTLPDLLKSATNLFNYSYNDQILGPKDGMQGPYYCSVGGSKAFGRELAENHASECEFFGIELTGLNAEVAPGQWEYQCFSKDALLAADNLWISRYILLKCSEDLGYDIDFSPKPAGKNYNGSGCHTNVSSNITRDTMRLGQKGYFQKLMNVFENRHSLHIEEYGKDNDKRLTGLHETQDINTFSWGVADRGASIRIPRETSIQWVGYFEDRRPAANCDPYSVVRLILEAISEAE